MAKRQIYLHAGVHRTGTSSLQMCLHVNRGAILGAGFDAAYPKRDGIASGELALRLPGPRHGWDHTDHFADRVFQEMDELNPVRARPLILSEENTPGRMIHFQGGQFYPAAEARLTALRQGLHKAEIRRVVFVLRQYDQLFVSAHRKRAEDNLCVRFSDLRLQMVAMDRGYPEILRLFQDILQPRELVVIRYENRGSSVDLLRNVVPGLQDVALKEPGRSLNISATDAALHALQDQYERGATLTRAQWQSIIAEHASDKRDLKFAEFTAEQRNAIKTRYEWDLERIAAMPAVTLI